MAAHQALAAFPWGLYRAVARTFERDDPPRFTRLQIDPTAAWQRRRELLPSLAADR